VQPQIAVWDSGKGVRRPGRRPDARKLKSNASGRQQLLKQLQKQKLSARLKQLLNR